MPASADLWHRWTSHAGVYKNWRSTDADKLQYRPAAMHGNPWLRLLRREVEDLARTPHGERYLREQQARTELARINRELKQLCAQLAALRERRAALLSELGEQGSPRQ